MMWLMILWVLGLGLPSDQPALAAEDVVRGLPDDCEFVAFVDARGMQDRVSAFATDLAAQPFVSSNPELSAMVGSTPMMMAEALAEISGELGFDPFSTLSSAAFCGRLVVGGAEPVPQALFVFQDSSRTTDVVAELMGVGEIAEELGPVTLSNGVSALGFTEDGQTIALVSPVPSLLLVGSDALLAPLVDPAAPGWSSPPAAGSLAGQLAALAPHGVRTFVGLQPSLESAGVAATEMGMSGGQLLLGLQSTYWAQGMGHNAVLSVTARDATSVRDHELILQGIAEAMVGAPLAARGMAHLVMGFGPDLERELGAADVAMIGQLDEVLTYLEGLGVVADPTVDVTTDAATHTTTLTIDGASSVFLMGLGMLPGVLLTTRGGTDEYRYEDAAPAAPAETWE